LQVAAVIAIVVILHVPLANYLARAYTAPTSWRVGMAIYRVVGVEPDNEQRWTKYLTSLLAFSAVSVLLLYGILLGQRICRNRGAIRE
jgi:K+-transporting ATPase ATPase A chain